MAIRLHTAVTASDRTFNPSYSPHALLSLSIILSVPLISQIYPRLLPISSLQQPQIILLKDGTDTSQGKAQLISNINACCAVVDAVRTTLGPRGMDKLIHDQKVRSVEGVGCRRRCLAGKEGGEGACMD